MFVFPQQLTDARSMLPADAPHKSSSQPPPPVINHGTHAPQTPRGGLVQHLPLHHGQWIPLHSMWCWWAAAAAGRCRDRLFRGWGTGSAFHGRTHGSRSVLQVGRWGRVTARVFLCFSLGLLGLGSKLLAVKRLGHVSTHAGGMTWCWDGWGSKLRF